MKNFSHRGVPVGVGLWGQENGLYTKTKVIKMQNSENIYFWVWWSCGGCLESWKCTPKMQADIWLSRLECRSLCGRRFGARGRGFESRHMREFGSLVCQCISITWSFDFWLLIASSDSTGLISIYPKSCQGMSKNQTVRVLIIVYHCSEKNNSAMILLVSEVVR